MALAQKKIAKSTPEDVAPNQAQPFYPAPKRPARGSVLESLPSRPPYPAKGSPEYDSLRLSLRAEFKRAAVIFSGAAKRAGCADRIDHSRLRRAGQHGLYDGLDTRGLSLRKDIERKTYFDRAGIAELAYNIALLRAGTRALRDLSPVLFVKDAEGHDAVAPVDARLAAANRAAAEHACTLSGERLRDRFTAAHARNGVPLAPERLPLHEPLKDVRKRAKARSR